MESNKVVSQEKITLQNKHNEKLVGVLHETGSADIVVLCHGFRSSKEQTTMVGLAVALANEGISAFRFDFAGNGESEGSFQYGGYMREVEDLRSVVEFFLQKHRKITSVLGHSKGLSTYCLLSGGEEHAAMVGLAVTLANEGISAFRFDFAGNGESEGSFQYGNYMREVEDLRSVVEFFVQKDRNITSVLGHSKGGNIVLLYASKYHDIGTVVNVSGRHRLDRGIEVHLGEDFLDKIKKDGYIDVKNKSDGGVLYRVTEESLMDRLNTNMHEACLAIDKDCRVLTVHGSADVFIPMENALELAKIIPNHKLHIVEGANHPYTNHVAELASVALAFIKEGQQQKIYS